MQDALAILSEHRYFTARPIDYDSRDFRERNSRDPEEDIARLDIAILETNGQGPRKIGK